jgi:serine/threonine-protein phosphatase 2B catalytic subunit
MDSLPDPLDDRVMKDVLPPPQKPLARSKLYPKKSISSNNNSKYLNLDTIPDWKLLRDHLAREGRLEKADLLELINNFVTIIKAEPNIVKIQDPVTVVGDIHGQYYDMLKLLEVGGNPEDTQYLFLGDYVDRGAFSIECVILLYALKVRKKINFPP